MLRAPWCMLCCAARADTLTHVVEISDTLVDVVETVDTLDILVNVVQPQNILASVLEPQDILVHAGCSGAYCETPTT